MRVGRWAKGVDSLLRSALILLISPVDDPNKSMSVVSSFDDSTSGNPVSGDPVSDGLMSDDPMSDDRVSDDPMSDDRVSDDPMSNDQVSSTF